MAQIGRYNEVISDSGRQIATQLKLSNYRIEPGPAALRHGTGWPARGSN